MALGEGGDARLLGRPVMALVTVGGDYLPRNLQCLAGEGRHISIASQRGATTELPIWVVMRNRLTLTGSTLRARDAAFKTGIRDALVGAVWHLLADGRLKPVIDSTCPLREAARAHARLDCREHVGKIVLIV